jgi:hypothetical protein
MRSYKTPTFLTLLIVALYSLLVVSAVAEAHTEVPADPTNAHLWADGVAFPTMQAAVNEYWRLHPADKSAAFDHVRGVDVKDLERGRAARESAETWAKAMKRAGY